ncbi:MAG: SDR family oxidoreductase [Limnochordia bacterium]|jgi:NAD(P)-dependent dehydrogenase (short-subunit alcohol dehydrogenase family)|nr:SDR family oxidoreductase [Limnochordia bacterium]
MAGNTQNLFDLKGKTAVITGGSGVLCGEMARALGKAGVKVVVMARRLEAVERVAEDIRAAGGTALALACDVLDAQALTKAREEIVTQFGGMDILVNGAGGNRPEATTSQERTFFELDFDSVRAVFDLNFLGSFLPTQIFGQLLAQKGKGSIVNISSAASFHPMTRVPAYAGAKAAINNFTEWLAVYLAEEFGGEIRVNAIAPGFFIGQQNYSLLIQPDGELTERGRKIVDHTPMGRFGEPGDLIGALLWLVSDASSFVTGTVVNVDGGFNAYPGV